MESTHIVFVVNVSSQSEDLVDWMPLFADLVPRFSLFGDH